jgi:hypothetical protein
MTAAACSQSECEECEIQGKLLCVHKPKDLIDFYVLFMGWTIPFFSGMIIGKFWVGIMVWFVLVILLYSFFCYKRTMVTLDVNFISDDRCGLDTAANSMQPLL